MQIEKILELKTLDFEERLLKVLEGFVGEKVVFTTSFSLEDQLITHIIALHNLNVEIVTIDTGRHFEETHRVFQQTLEKYPTIHIGTLFPREDLVTNFVNTKGINGFYNSYETRTQCCFIRKVEPLNRFLKNGKYKLWISGVRASHSQTRTQLDWIEKDLERDILKIYPIFDLTKSDVEGYIKKHNIPYNSLYNNGFTSIGCAPCTKAPLIGDDPRSGRWWWEFGEKTECGLHINKVIK